MESSAASHAVGGIRRVGGRGSLQVVCGEIAEQLPRGGECTRLVPGRQVRDATPRRVGGRAAEVLGVDLLVRHGAHDVRAGDEHVARPLDHDGEVRHRRRVDRATGARPQDDGDLRHDARGEHVAQEDLGVTAERRHALLDSRPARIVQPDDRHADLHREVHHLADLLGVGLGQRAAEDGEVLAEDVHQPAVDAAVAGDDAVAERMLVGDPEFGRAMDDIPIELDERAGVEQQLESLARRQLAHRMLLLDSRGSPAGQRFIAHRVEPGESFVVRGHRESPCVFAQGQDVGAAFWP